MFSWSWVSSVRNETGKLWTWSSVLSPSFMNLSQEYNTLFPKAIFFFFHKATLFWFLLLLCLEPVAVPQDLRYSRGKTYCVIVKLTFLKIDTNLDCDQGPGCWVKCCRMLPHHKTEKDPLRHYLFKVRDWLDYDGKMRMLFFSFLNDSSECLFGRLFHFSFHCPKGIE